MKVRVDLVTKTDLKDFVNSVADISKEVYLHDNNKFCVSAHSLIGVMCSMDWKETWVECEEDIYNRISKWVTI